MISSVTAIGQNMICDDDLIIAQFLERDETAITNVECKYGKYCHAIAFPILYDEEDTKECLNDTWLKAWNSIPPTIPEILSAYLGKITRNLAINRYRQQNALKRTCDYLAEPLEELQECVSLSMNNVSEEMNKQELEEVINSYLDGISKQKRQMFVRRYFYFDDIEEIAKRFHMKESSVKVALHRMRKALKFELEKEGYEI